MRKVRGESAAERRRRLARELAATRAREERARKDRRNERDRARRAERRRRIELGEYGEAREWLETIQAIFADAGIETELQTTDAGGGHATMKNPDEIERSRTPWLIVGSFEPKDEIGYQDLAAGFIAVDNDPFLAARINPQRLSQIRVVFSDPNSTRLREESVVSKIGPWEYVVSDLVGEIVGADLEDPSEGSLAARYKESVIPMFYVFFAGHMANLRSVTWPGKTTSVDWRLS